MLCGGAEAIAANQRRQHFKPCIHLTLDNLDAI